MNDLEVTTTPDGKRGTRFLAILVLCYLVSFLGAEGAMRGLGDWYPALARPSWAPPMALFIPLWTLVYGALAVAAWQVWEEREKPAGHRAIAIACLVPQAMLGGAWPWIFFAYRSLLFSTIEGGVVWVLTGLSIWAFARVKASAALLLIPYWTWVAYLSALAFALYRSSR